MIFLSLVPIVSATKLIYFAAQAYIDFPFLYKNVSLHSDLSEFGILGEEGGTIRFYHLVILCSLGKQQLFPSFFIHEFYS